MTPADLRAIAHRALPDPVMRTMDWDASFVMGTEEVRLDVYVVALQLSLRTLMDHLDSPTVTVPHEGVVR